MTVNHSKEWAGKEITINKRFMWAEREWIIPSVYVGSKELVVDFCMKIEPAQIQAFMDKWNLNIENEAYREFSKEEEMQLELENPLCFHFCPKIVLNGKQLKTSHGSGRSYNPCIPKEYKQSREAEMFIEKYGMDKAYGWMFWRSHFPWIPDESKLSDWAKRKMEIKSLEIIMEQQKAAVPGLHFHADKVGDIVKFTHPGTGAEYKLTIQGYEKQEMNVEHMLWQNLEYPTHYHQMTYTIEPEMENGVMTIEDCTEGDRPRQKEEKHDSNHSAAAASIGIIGGADGPTALVIGNRSVKLNVACSSLHYEPVEKIEWRMVFHEKKYDEGRF